MWELDHKEGRVLNKWWFWIVMLKKTLESSLDSKEIKPVNPKGNKPWYSLEGLMLKLKLWYLSLMMRRTDSLEKDSDVGKDWRQEKKTTEDEMVGWHHWLDGHEFQQILGDGEGQGSLACCSHGSQRVGHNWATEQWTAVCIIKPNMIAYGRR